MPETTAKPQDLKHLEHKIRALNQQLRKLAAAETGAQQGAPEDPLWTIIHHPGWTSVRDVQVVEHLVDSLQQQLGAFSATRDATIQQATAAARKPEVSS
jgi:hypothetical protein